MNESLFSKRMILKQQEKEKSKLVLEKEKWRIAEIIDVISKSNNAILINHVGEIIDAESRKSLETDRNISQWSLLIESVKNVAIHQFK